MRLSWNFSFFMLTVYLGLFLLWMTVPSRTVFMAAGTLAVAALVWQMRRVSSSGYFLNQVDKRLHCLVIADVFLETISFEVFRLFQPLAVVDSFHQNMNFVGCATAFTFLIGGYRFFASRRPALALPTSAVASVDLS